MTRGPEGVARSRAMSGALSLEQEAALARRWRAEGDRTAAEALARGHVAQVMAQARRYRSHGIPLCDLVGEGNLGLMVALSKFEPERGVPFGAYASYWIKACITSRVSSDRGLSSGQFFRLRRERARVACELGAGEAAERTLAERLSLSLERTREQLARLDARSVPPQEADQAADPWEEEQLLVRFQDQRRLSQRVSRALASLDPRERYIAEQRLMVDDQDKPTLAELARHFKVSRERVGRLEARTKRKLRERIAESDCAPGSATLAESR